MNKQQLIYEMRRCSPHFREAGLSVAEIEACLATLAYVARQELGCEDGEVPLPGLGRLKTVRRAARRGVNPATGAPIEIPERLGVRFVAAKAMKGAIA